MDSKPAEDSKVPTLATDAVFVKSTFDAANTQVSNNIDRTLVHGLIALCCLVG